MKQLLLIASALILTISISSCNKEDNSNNGNRNQLTEDARYYVKYEASSGGTYLFLYNVSVNTENGVQTFTERVKGYSQTFGPVKKGFTASITVDAGASAKVSIYVCKGEEPFALKETGNNSASYVIDF